jgi:hypothetical protein
LAPPQFPAVTNTTINSSYFNNVMNDLFAGLGQVVTRSGQSPWTANLPAGGFKLTGLAVGAANGESVAFGQAAVTFGAVSSSNYFTATQATTDTGIFGFGNSNGPGMVAWGSATGGAGRMEFNAAGAKQFDIGPIAAAVNFVRVLGGTAGNGPSLSAVGTDANVGMNYTAQGTQGHFFYGSGAIQFNVATAAGATRYISLAGSAGGNPTLGTTAGNLNVVSPTQFTSTAAPPAGNVGTTMSYAFNTSMGGVASAATANNRVHEWYWNGGSLSGRMVNDAYNTTLNWLTVVGGQAAGIASIDLATGAGVQAVRVTSSQNMLVGGATADTYASAGRHGVEVNGTSEALFGLVTGANGTAFILQNASGLSVSNQANTALSFGTNNVGRLTISAAGGLYASSIHNNASGAGSGSTTQQFIASGTYVPTLTGITNVASTGVGDAQWLRVGNVVTVSGRLIVTPTAGGSLTTVTAISLPLASNITSSDQVGGCAGNSGNTVSTGVTPTITGDAATDTARLAFGAASTVPVIFSYHFTYVIA